MWWCDLARVRRSAIAAIAARPKAAGGGCGDVPNLKYLIRLVCYLLVAYVPVNIPWSVRVSAQEAQKVNISVPPTLFLRLGTDNSFPVAISPASAVTAGFFVVLGGLPPSIVVSKGYVVAPGLWSLPAEKLEGLSIMVGDGKLGRWDVVVRLVDAGNVVVAEAKTVFVVVPGDSVARPETRIPPSSVPGSGNEPAAKEAPLSAAERARAFEFYKSGVEQLKNGNIYAARKFFERGAAMGLGDAALALGDTLNRIRLLS